MKAGFVNIFGRPNAGKSTLLNLLVGEKLAIVSPKVQTTRHRIKGILTENDYQIIFSDTPGIIEPKYKLHERMMQAVKSSLEDADVALLLVDIRDDWKSNEEMFAQLRLKVPSVVLVNKVDTAQKKRIAEAVSFFETKDYCRKVLTISALNPVDREVVLGAILEFLPEGEKFYDDDTLTDLSTRFFVSELIREKIYELFEQEVPYHTAVVVQEFEEQPALTKIRAEIIVHRESQKGIILGEGGSMIKKLGIAARREIEEFIQRKVFLELFVKVRRNWREDDLHLKEYGY